MILWGIFSVGIDITDQLLIRFFAFIRYYDSVRREILYNILLEFRVPMKLVRLIKVCLNETYSKVHRVKNIGLVCFLSKMD
jgi:hypothetical protein